MVTAENKIPQNQQREIERKNLYRAEDSRSDETHKFKYKFKYVYIVEKRGWCTFVKRINKRCRENLYLGTLIQLGNSF